MSEVQAQLSIEQIEEFTDEDLNALCEATDAAIIDGVLTDWHTEKGEKFRKSTLETWLGWMRRHALIPGGRAPHTVHTMTRDMFA